MFEGAAYAASESQFAVATIFMLLSISLKISWVTAWLILLRPILFMCESLALCYRPLRSTTTPNSVFLRFRVGWCCGLDQSAAGEIISSTLNRF